MGDETINIDVYDFVPVKIHTQTKKTSTVGVEFNTASPATVASGSTNEIWIPICEVAKAGGVASVEEQILSYNPVLSVEIAEAL